MEFKDLITEKVKEKFSDSVEDIIFFKDELTLVINKNKILEAAKFLKEETSLDFAMCEDVTAVDWGTRKKRYSVVYHIYSISNNFRLRIKSNIEQSECKIDSVTSVWASADWYERETFDMYGIEFNHHPDLRRMYMPEEFEYYPLRKDFPVMGIPGSLPLPKQI